MIKQAIAAVIQKGFAVLGEEKIPFTIDYASDTKHGDYSTNVALIAAKKIGKNLPAGRQGPMELAEEIAESLRSATLFEKVEVAKPGFINFWVKNEVLKKEISEQAIPQIGKGKKVIVEYSSPNIAKPFTIGHLRSTIIGDAIANLLQAVGYEVFRDNHIGDWGTQFGKQIYAIKTWGDEKQIETSDRPVKDLVSLYVKFHEEAEKDPSLEEKAREWFKKLEDGDQEARVLWGDCIEWSWKEFNAIYKQLDVSFTENGGRGYGESFFEDKMKPILKELQDKKIMTEGKEGAKIVEFPEESNLPPLMILKKDGATLYATRDLATDKFRLLENKKYGQDVMIINEVGAEQSLYFQQLYKLEEMLGWVKPGQRVHIKHGLYRFKEGKMSTRKGNVIWLEDVLNEVEKRAFKLANESANYEGSSGKQLENRKKLVQKRISVNQSEPINFDNDLHNIAIGALKWNDLKRDSKQDIAFDWDEILNMQGNSGPYLQYTCVRTQSVISKSKATKQSYEKIEQSGGLLHTLSEFAMTNQLHPEERELLRLLARFSEIVEDAAVRYAPNALCTYLFEVAQAFNLFYQKQQILKAEDAVRDFRLFLTVATGNVLKQGLNLLGIQTPEKM